MGVSWLYVEVCGNLTVFYGKRSVKKKNKVRRNEN